jgi:hypothetical protein
MNKSISDQAVFFQLIDLSAPFHCAQDDKVGDFVAYIESELQMATIFSHGIHEI